MSKQTSSPPTPALRGDPNESPEGFTWTDAYELGWPAMDQTHKEMVELTRATIDATDEEIHERFARLKEHTEAHFEQENRWMEETEFPPRDCHIDEHNAVLASMREVSEALADGGDVEFARNISRELARWFPGHADYLDSALAHWLVKRDTGGKPIVFHKL